MGDVMIGAPGIYVLRCKRCGRECHPWPLKRSAICAPKNWANCIAPIEYCEVVEVVDAD